MLKKWYMAMLAGLMTLSATGVSAGDVAERKLRFFGQLEYWTTDDAFEKNESELNEYVDSVVASLPPGFLTTVNKEFNVDPGNGARLGVLYPVQPSVLIGGSLGYITGPKNKTSYYLSDGVDFETTAIEEKTTFVRALVEVRKHFKLTDALGLRLGGGIGIAQGKIKQSFFYNDSFGGGPFGNNPSKTWSGVTWELVPSLLVKAGKTNFEIGVAYADFPGLKEDSDFNKLDWTPFGIRLGLEF
jgi:hypothetical protein